jgi:hypothetical protein
VQPQKFRTSKLSIFWQSFRKLKVDFDLINRSIDLIDESIEKKFNEMRIDFEEREALLNRPLTDRNDINKMLEVLEKDNFVRREFPSTIHQTFIVKSHTIFERCLIELTRKYVDLVDDYESFNKMVTNKKIKEYLKYLKQIDSLETKDLDQDLNMIYKYGRLRNLIAHYDGNWEEYSLNNKNGHIKDLRKFIDDEESLALTKDRLLVTDRSVITKFFNRSIKVNKALPSSPVETYHNEEKS